MFEERNQFMIGEESSFTKVISDNDIRQFSQITGDENPIHLDDGYAQVTHFGGRIAHGMLIGGLISAVLGTRLPGPGAIYLSQGLRFLAPVRPGDTVTARVKVTEWDSVKGRITLLTDAINQDGVTVATGEAKLIMAAFLGAK
jgi:3-hydroxybutyryl-CoA dehydratase